MTETWCWWARWLASQPHFTMWSVSTITMIGTLCYTSLLWPMPVWAKARWNIVARLWLPSITNCVKLPSSWWNNIRRVKASPSLARKILPMSMKLHTVAHSSFLPTVVLHPSYSSWTTTEVSVWYSIRNVTRWVPYWNRSMVTIAPSSARAIIMKLSTWAAGRTMNIVSLRDRCLLSAFLVRLVSYTPWHLRLRMAPSHVSPVITCHSKQSSGMSLSRVSTTIMTTTLCERDFSS